MKTVELKACSGVNSVDCGLFCANSPVICVKHVFIIINKILSYATAIKTLSFKPEPKKAQAFARSKNFLVTNSFENIKMLLINHAKQMVSAIKSSRAYKAFESTEDLRALVSGVNSILALGEETATGKYNK